LHAMKFFPPRGNQLMDQAALGMEGDKDTSTSDRI
jgi:hypothetical protein